MKFLYWLPIAALLLPVATLAGAQFIDPRETFDEHHRQVMEENAKPKVYDILTAQAKALLRKKEIDKAIPLLQKALAIAPDHIDANELLADIYMQRKRPEEALQPIVYTQSFQENGVGGLLIPEMKYILALLDTGHWEEAAALYEKGIRDPLHWTMPGYYAGKGSPEFTLPNVHFTSGYADMPGLRAQAHLILGSRQPIFGLAGLDQKDHLPYMYDQLQQALKSNRNSLEAQFLSAVALGSMKRYEEARKAFAVVSKNAPRETRPEIKVAQAYFDKLEETQKNYAAQEAKRLAEQKAQALGNVAP